MEGTEEMIKQLAKLDILRWYFNEGRPIKEIARELKISKNTVKKYIKKFDDKRKELLDPDVDSSKIIETMLEKPKYNSSNHTKRVLTDEITNKIDEFLKENVFKIENRLEKQILKAIDIHEELEAQGYKISYTTVAQYVAKQRIKKKESYIGLERYLDEEIISTVRKGIELHTILLIKYHSFTTDEETEREFDPYIIEIYEGCYYLIGYCHLRESIRDLRISGIKQVRLMEETFERPKRFYENYKKGRFGKLGGEKMIELILRFSGEGARYVLEYESAKADTLIEEDDGTITFQRTTTMTLDIIKWVLCFGENITIIEPEVFRETIVRRTKGMMEKHKV